MGTQPLRYINENYQEEKPITHNVVTCSFEDTKSVWVAVAAKLIRKKMQLNL